MLLSFLNPHDFEAESPHTSYPRAPLEQAPAQAVLSDYAIHLVAYGSAIGKQNQHCSVWKTDSSII